MKEHLTCQQQLQASKQEINMCNIRTRSCLNAKNIMNTMKKTWFIGSKDKLFSPRLSYLENHPNLIK